MKNYESLYTPQDSLIFIYHFSFESVWVGLCGENVIFPHLGWLEVSRTIPHDYDSSSWRHHFLLEERCPKNALQAIRKLRGFFRKNELIIIYKTVLRIHYIIWLILQSIRSQEIVHMIQKRLRASRRNFLFFYDFFFRSIASKLGFASIVKSFSSFPPFWSPKSLHLRKFNIKIQPKNYKTRGRVLKWLTNNYYESPYSIKSIDIIIFSF